jgi:hypothetical protein
MVLGTDRFIFILHLPVHFKHILGDECVARIEGRKTRCNIFGVSPTWKRIRGSKGTSQFGS